MKMYAQAAKSFTFCLPDCSQKIISRSALFLKSCAERSFRTEFWLNFIYNFTPSSLNFFKLFLLIGTSSIFVKHILKNTDGLSGTPGTPVKPNHLEIMGNGSTARSTNGKFFFSSRSNFYLFLIEFAPFLYQPFSKSFPSISQYRFGLLFVEISMYIDWKTEDNVFSHYPFIRLL